MMVSMGYIGKNAVKRSGSAAISGAIIGSHLSANALCNWVVKENAANFQPPVMFQFLFSATSRCSKYMIPLLDNLENRLSQPGSGSTSEGVVSRHSGPPYHRSGIVSAKLKVSTISSPFSLEQKLSKTPPIAAGGACLLGCCLVKY